MILHTAATTLAAVAMSSAVTVSPPRLIFGPYLGPVPATRWAVQYPDREGSQY